MARLTDDELLMNMGYKPELKRRFGMLEVFGVSLASMSIVPGISAVFMDSLIFSGVGLTWGWFVPCIFIFLIALSISELSSSFPTSGGLYYWTHMAFPEKYKNPVSFLVGYANLFGLIGSVCSIDYGFASMVLALPAIQSDGDFSPTKYQEFGVYCACVISQCVVACISTSFVSKSQWYLIFINIVLIFVVAIAFPVGRKHKGYELNSGSFVFGDTNNTSDWDNGWAFLLSWMSAIWTISAVDCTVHLSEEAKNAAVSIPVSIIGSIGCCWIFGFLIMSIVAAVIDQDFTGIIDTKTGMPFAQVILNCLGKKWAMGIVVILVVTQWLVGLSVMTPTARLTFALARDNAQPFSNVWKKVIRTIPIYATIINVFISILLACLILIGEEAANAVFTVPVSSNGLSWLLPIFGFAWLAPEGTFIPGPFYMGKVFSRIVATIASVYLVFVILVLANIPTVRHVDKTTMNYTVVINVGIWVLCMLYYYTYAHKIYHGPQITLETDEGLPSAEHVVHLPGKATEAKEAESSSDHFHEKPLATQ